MRAVRAQKTACKNSYQQRPNVPVKAADTQTWLGLGGIRLAYQATEKTVACEEKGAMESNQGASSISAISPIIAVRKVGRLTAICCVKIAR